MGIRTTETEILDDEVGVGPPLSEADVEKLVREFCGHLSGRVRGLIVMVSPEAGPGSLMIEGESRDILEMGNYVQAQALDHSKR